MRTFLLMVVGALLGAAVFHAYYLRLDASARCGWDHPLDAGARRACREAASTSTAHGYAPKARQDLDSLIGRVAR